MPAPLARITQVGQYISIESVEPVPVVRVDLPAVGEPYAVALGNELRDAAIGGQGRLVVDFRQVQGVCSACLRELVELSRFCMERGGGLCVCNLPAELVRLLRVTRLDRRFGVAASVEDAVERVLEESRSSRLAA